MDGQPGPAAEAVQMGVVALLVSVDENYNLLAEFVISIFPCKKLCYSHFYLISTLHYGLNCYKKIGIF